MMVKLIAHVLFIVVVIICSFSVRKLKEENPNVLSNLLGYSHGWRGLKRGETLPVADWEALKRILLEEAGS